MPSQLSTMPLAPLFVPHGAPTFALRPGAAGAALSRFAAGLPTPRAIVIVSPHWNTDVPTVGTADRLETIHDFSGFPEELYRLRYPASGCREAADEVVATLAASGLAVREDGRRGLDHGAWIPLRLMFPDAEVPVIPLSLQSRKGPQGAWLLGRALAPLVERGFLIIGSGNVTHNLRDFQRVHLAGGQPPDYVREFPEWLAGRLAARDLPALLDYRRQSPGGIQAHPSDEHLLPLFVALGAAGDGATAQRFHAGIDDYVIAMDAYSFTPRPEGQA